MSKGGFIEAMIIGLTGKNGSGKGEVVNILTASGFICHSLSDIIRDEIKKKGEAVTRDKLIEMGNLLRKEGGPAALAERILKKLDPEKNYTIDSIRNPAEVRVLRARSDFCLLHVSCPQKLRFERTRTRGRENDPETFEEFVKIERKELKGLDPTQQQLDQTIALADREIANDSSLQDLQKNILDVLRDLSKKNSRPGWDEYFMGIAKVAALRSNCIKRKVAAVIVKDRRIISTGYNGTPRGIKNCNEGGCPRCNTFGESGANLDACLCSHAEENAIVQSAYHGVQINGSTLYTTFSPCLQCTKMIINSGIREVVFHANYPMSEVALKLLSEAYLQVRRLS